MIAGLALLSLWDDQSKNKINYMSHKHQILQNSPDLPRICLALLQTHCFLLDQWTQMLGPEKPKNEDILLQKHSTRDKIRECSIEVISLSNAQSIFKGSLLVQNPI